IGVYAKWATQIDSVTATFSVRRRVSLLLTYALCLAFFGLGLMSKPMVVTLPCVFLLLDYWPVHRLRTKQNLQGRSIWRLAQEKWPFFLMSALGSTATLVLQRSEGAMVTVG